MFLRDFASAFVFIYLLLGLVLQPLQSYLDFCDFLSLLATLYIVKLPQGCTNLFEKGRFELTKMISKEHNNYVLNQDLVEEIGKYRRLEFTTRQTLNLYLQGVFKHCIRHKAKSIEQRLCAEGVKLMKSELEVANLVTEVRDLKLR